MRWTRCSRCPFSVFAIDALPDLHVVLGRTAGQFFARWRYEPVEEEGTLDLGGEGEVVDGYRRIDNITDEALKRFAAAYGDAITKDDIFFYVYGLLHSPEYRETYAADLKKMLPRIPLVEDPWPFVEAGRKLSDLHLGYESVTPYPLDGLDAEPLPGEDPYDFYRVQKMAFAKVRDPETKKLVADRSTMKYNSAITLSGIPEEAYRYQLGSRSAVEWILDRYQVKTDKASGIVNDPNDWSQGSVGPPLHHRPARPDRHGEPRDHGDRRRPPRARDPRGPEPHMSTSEMSPYELKAWESSVARLNRRRDSRVRKAVGAGTAPVKRAAKSTWAAIPHHEDLETQVMKALDGLKAVTYDPALRSVDAEKALKRHGVARASEMRDLDLRQLDRSLPGFRTAFTTAAVIEGGGSALVVTGAEVSSTVSGGVTVGVAVAAIAADAVASMALMGRIIGQVAAEYGYDVRLPEEEAYALGVMSIGTAATAAEKAAALRSLRLLTTRMMRQATWAELNQHGLVKLINKLFVAIGEKLTKRKLAQAVPVAGVFINAGLSAQMADSTYRAARDVYRLRFLSDKYGLDPATWQPVDSGQESDGDLLAEALGSIDAPESQAHAVEALESTGELETS